ncbi:MAG: hypothetical protein JNL98_22075 [Bryobacterales bacterium]|nr:hypothetical protein [Bryobacterales bacterium]
MGSLQLALIDSSSGTGEASFVVVLEVEPYDLGQNILQLSSQYLRRWRLIATSSRSAFWSSNGQWRAEQEVYQKSERGHTSDYGFIDKMVFYDEYGRAKISLTGVGGSSLLQGYPDNFQPGYYSKGTIFGLSTSDLVSGNVYWYVLPSTPAPESLWVGGGAKIGGTAYVVGAELSKAFLINAMNYQKRCLIDCEAVRLGVGYGGAAGLFVLIGSGVTETGSWKGVTFSGLDFAASAGANFAKLPAALRLSKFAGPLVHLAKNIKSLASITSEAWESAANNAKLLVTFSGITYTSPTLSVFDLPISEGVELALYYSWGTVKDVTPF